MLLYQASLDRVASLGDIKDKDNMVALEHEQHVVNVSECIGTLDNYVIQVGGSVHITCHTIIRKTYVLYHNISIPLILL